MGLAVLTRECQPDIEISRLGSRVQVEKLALPISSPLPKKGAGCPKRSRMAPSDAARHRPFLGPSQNAQVDSYFYKHEL